MPNISARDMYANAKNASASQDVLFEQGLFNPLLASLLGGQNDVQKYQTPGIGGELNLPTDNGPFGKADAFLNTPGGGFLMNLLAQSGYSKMPHSPLGAIGKAALMSQNQNQQRQQSQLQQELIRSQIGLNNAKSAAEGMGGSVDPKTTIGKLMVDRRNGLLTDEQLSDALRDIGDARLGNLQDRTTKLRGQFRTDSDGLRATLTDLAKAKALIQQGGAISDTAAFTSFIRSIDNSVVRPAEQAAYSQAGGMARAFEDAISKLQGTGPLSVRTREDLLGAIEAIESQVRGIHDRTIDYYNTEAGVWGLRPEGVTGIPMPDAVKVDLSGRNSNASDEMTDTARRYQVTEDEWKMMPPEDRALFND